MTKRLIHHRGFSLSDQVERSFLPSLHFGGQGTVIAPGQSRDAVVPFDCQLSAVYVYANTPGDLTLAISAGSYGDYTATLAAIDGATPITFAGAQKYKDEALTDWIRELARGDVLKCQVSAINVITRFVCHFNVELL